MLINTHINPTALTHRDDRNVGFWELDRRVGRWKDDLNFLDWLELRGEHKESEEKECNIDHWCHVDLYTNPPFFEFWHLCYLFSLSAAFGEDLDDVVACLVNHVGETVHLIDEEVVGDNCDDRSKQAARCIDEGLGNSD